MKGLSKIFSIIILLIAILTVTNIVSPNLLNDIFGDSTIISKFFYVLSNAVIPIITICLCSYAMERKNESYIIRVIMAYMYFSIILFVLKQFVPFADINEQLYSVINNIAAFVSQSHVFLLAITTLQIVKPNNVICKNFKLLGHIAVIVNIISTLWLYIKVFLVEKLPNVYGDAGFNFSSISDTVGTVGTIYAVTITVLIFSIILTYLTNYAFEDNVVEASELSYDELKDQALQVTQTKIDSIYKKESIEETTPNSLNSDPKLMNISNQLGADSNVGQVTNKELPQMYIERKLPTSSGPVINNNLNLANGNEQMNIQNSQTQFNNINQTNQFTNNNPSLEQNSFNTMNNVGIQNGNQVSQAGNPPMNKPDLLAPPK